MTLTEALRAAAQHVERHRVPETANGAETLSDDDQARVAALGHEIDALAAASETAPVYPREYEVIRAELERRGFVLPPELAQAVMDAFVAEATARVGPRRPSRVARARSVAP